MSESAASRVLSAEVRVLQVGNRQITRSMYGNSTKQLSSGSSHSAG